MEAIILLIVVILLCFFWVYQFVQLMLLAEQDFPGRYDKPLWVAVFVFTFFLAPFAFLYWKIAYLAMRQAEQHDRQGKA